MAMEEVLAGEPGSLVTDVYKRQECGRVFDLEMPELEILQQQASQCCDGMIQDYRLEFSGVCADCLKLNKKAN